MCSKNTLLMFLLSYEKFFFLNSGNVTFKCFLNNLKLISVNICMYNGADSLMVNAPICKATVLAATQV